MSLRCVFGHRWALPGPDGEPWTLNWYAGHREHEIRCLRCGVLWIDQHPPERGTRPTQPKDKS